jgi:hypothetical protein
MRRIKTVMLAVVLAITALATTGCIKPFDVPEYQEIGPSETAFMLPMEGETSDQAKFESEEFLAENKVAAKRVQIPHKAIKTGRFYWNVKYVGTVMLIKVDRAPVTREWTEDVTGKDGTSVANQGIVAQSADSISYNVRVNCTAQIDEVNAARYLYRYRNKTLDQVMDTEIRPQVEKLFVASASAKTYDEAVKGKAEMMAAVEKQVTAFFAERGVTITQIGLKGEFTPLKPEIAEAYAKVAAARQEKVAQTEINAKNISEAEAKKKAAQAMSDELTFKLKQIELQQMALDNQAAWIQKWDGTQPTTILGANTSVLYGPPTPPTK